MAEPDDLNAGTLRARAVQAARGAADFDLLIENAQLLDMITGRTRRADIGLIGPLIASVHPPAPSRRADIALVSDLEHVTVTVTRVIANGHVVASAGKEVDPIPAHPVPNSLCSTVKSPEFAPDDFEIAATGPRARIATLSRPRFPVWGTCELDVQNGHLVLPDDLTRMAVCNRHGAGTPTRVAVLENWGRWRGAFATTISHDSHNLTLFGRDLRDTGGGLAVAARGEIRAILPLPVAGPLSEAPLPEVASALADLRAELDGLVDWSPPYLVFKALFGASLVCNAGPRLSDVGLVDPFENRILQSCVLSEG